MTILLNLPQAGFPRRWERPWCVSVASQAWPGEAHARSLLGPFVGCVGTVSGSSGCSLIGISINSSSSRAAPLLWTRPVLPMLAPTCVTPKPVWRRGQKAGLACNNFARAPVCVDNRSVVPILSTDLYTAVLRHCLIPPESTKPASGQDRGLWKKKGPAVNNRTLVGGRQNCAPGRASYFAGVAGCCGAGPSPPRMPWRCPCRPSP